MDVIDFSEYHPPRIPSKKWRELINPSSPCGLRRDSRKVWEVDPLICAHCGAEMKVIALLDDPAVIEKILRHLKLWPEGMGASVAGINGAVCLSSVGGGSPRSR